MDKKLDKVVFLGMYPWYDQSINDTVRCLVRAADGLQRVYIDPPLGLRATVTNGKYLLQSLAWQSSTDGDVNILKPPLGFAPMALGLRAQADRWAAKKLDTMLNARWGPQWREETLLYVSSYSYTQRELIKELAPRHLFFHIVDDNFSFPSVQNDRRVWQAQEKYFTYMMANSTVVTAVSPVIAEKYSEKYQRSVEVLRNGVDVPHFAAAANSLPPEDLLAVDRPVLLFIGAINSWIDIKLLDQVAQSLPESLLILVGPCFNDSVDQATWQRLTSRTNVRWLGSKPYQQLPQYAGVAKVLLLPRTNDEHSRASDPLKLYEYLATGQAVVSTPLPSALQYSDYVYVAETPEEFVQQIKLALVEHTTDQAARQREFAQQFAWPHKIKQMSQLLEQSANVTL